jgi:class 3 adenylate cyclase/tetratricopeptide (TPR) repeat protein
MKCPECQKENPETRKFCRECGVKLILLCLQCASENLPGDKFCGECGHDLSLPSEPTPKEFSHDEKIAKIQKYLPKGLTEKILSQRDKIEGERKQVTVMFCDMEGYSQLSDRLGPEEAYSIMDQVYEILIHKVHDYEGTVNEMTGDGIMALFGAPIALEDAPQRAIRSAMAIHREMARFSDRMKEEGEGIPPIKMRVGIHTGPVVVGSLGNDLRVEFKAVGETVNLASRMEGLAEPGSTYVTHDTFKLIEGFFRFEALGEKEIKGKEEPVRVYRVIAPSTRRTRFDVSAERGLIPFVGREREIEILLDAFERAKAGRGQAFSIVAEAGVGKSRLLYEFRKAVANEDVTFLEGRCLSYTRGVAYHPVIDILKSNFDIGESDTDSEIREKVKTGLKAIGVDEATSLPYLLELLSVEDSGIDRIPMSPEARKYRIIETLNRNVLKGSEMRPVILAVEDLHWIDKSSEERFKYLLDSISGARIFLIFTYRPEFIHTWGARSYHSQINLNRLSNRESLAMVFHLLGTKNIDSDLEDLILEKTEGVPLFIEEFIKSLKDLNIIKKKDDKYHLAKDIKDVVIPSTIQDVIMARVDSLPEGTKGVLQTGSVIEREFSYGLIKSIMDLPEQQLLSHLSALKDSELLYERGIYPQSAYIFKHALTREVVYDSILAKRKKNLHEKIGCAIEDLYQENIDEQYGVLVEHFIEGGNYEKGAEYSEIASKKSEKTASINDAIAYAQKRIQCLEKLPLNEKVQKKIIDTRTGLGLYFIQFNYSVKAKDAVGPIIATALRMNHKRRLSQIFAIMGHYEFFVEEDLFKALGHLEEALRISEEVNDILSIFFANYCMGFILMWSCEFEKANYHFRKALDINVAANSLWGISAMKVFLSWICFLQGNISLGYQSSEEALRMAEESGDIYSKSSANIVHGYLCIGKGAFTEGEQYLLKGIDLSERINLLIWVAVGKGCLGEHYYQIGEYEKSKSSYEKGIWCLEQAMIGSSWVNFDRIGIAKAMVMNNEKGVDLELLYGYARENKIKAIDGDMQRYIGEILLNIDDQHFSEAEDWIQKAIEADSKNGMMWHLGRDYALYAELFKRKENQSKAKENLSKAIEIFKDCGADGWVKKYEEELASL